MGTRKTDLMSDTGRFETDRTKAVIMLSGGIDSTTLAYQLAADSKYQEIHAFFSNMGVANTDQEYNAVNRTCLILGLRLVEGDFRWWRKALGGIIPAFESDPAIVSPMLGEQSRKSVSVNAACAVYAETIGSFDMYHGANKDDLQRYSFLPSTLRSIESMMSLGHPDRQFAIHTPWMERTSVEVLEEALRLGVPIEDTWSCLLGQSKHCGECLGCQGRRRRLERVIRSRRDFRDPTVYLRPKKGHANAQA